MSKAGKSSEIPSLKKSDGTWARTADDKANLFADTFASKWILPEALSNRYSLPTTSTDAENTFVPIRDEEAKYFLTSLDASSRTDPDL